jgi:hypothetical protein
MNGPAWICHPQIDTAFEAARFVEPEPRRGFAGAAIVATPSCGLPRFQKNRRNLCPLFARFGNASKVRPALRAGA